MQPVNSIPPSQFPQLAPSNVWDAVGALWDNTLVNPLNAVGLYDRPLLRGAIATALVGGALYLKKPESQFVNGVARDWSVLNPQDDYATPFPWWFVAGTVGVMVTLFI